MTTLRTAAQQALEALELTSEKRDPMRVAAITALRTALAHPAPEPVAWAGYDLDGMVEAFSRVIEAHFSSRHPFHNPIDMDAKMALRILRGIVPAMKAYAVPPQQPAPEPVAWVEHEWSGTGSRKLHFEKRDPTVRDEVVNPVWTPLYTDPPKRQPLSGLEVERLLEQVIGSLPAARNLVRAVERAHGIIEPRIEEDSHQTLDEAMQQPRAMAQAYENGYKAGAAAERKRIIQFLTEMQRQVGDGHNYYGVAAMRIREMV